MRAWALRRPKFLRSSVAELSHLRRMLEEMIRHPRVGLAHLGHRPPAWRISATWLNAATCHRGAQPLLWAA